MDRTKTVYLLLRSRGIEIHNICLKHDMLSLVQNKFFHIRVEKMPFKRVDCLIYSRTTGEHLHTYMYRY